MFMCVSIVGYTQVKFGIKGGVSTYDLGANDALMIVTNTSDFLLNVRDAKYGYHVGFVFQGLIGAFVIQPEIVFNSNTVDYTFEDVANSTVNNVFSEKYNNVDLPIMMGLKAGPLRLMAGPVGHFFINSVSDLDDLEFYDPMFDTVTFGWEAGIGLDFLNLMLDIRYEGNFYSFGDHFNFAGNSYAFDSNPARLLASLAITIR